MTNCTIRSIRGGTIFVATEERTLLTLEPRAIERLSFDDLPLLDAVERAHASGHKDETIRSLVTALVNVDTPMHRLWLHARLAEEHDRRGEYVSAARHACDVFMIDGYEAWSFLSPDCEIEEASFEIVHEAFVVVQDADQAVTNDALAREVDRMLFQIRPLHAKLKRGHRGALPDAKATVSGIAIDDVLDDADATTQDGSDRQASTQPPVLPRPEATSSTRDIIQQLLDERNFDEALRHCERIRKSPGDRDIDAFLFQFATALGGIGRTKDAVTTYLRCAIEFPQSRYAPTAMLQAAQLYVDAFDNRQTAARLAHRAASMARGAGESGLEKSAQALADRVLSGGS